jgi:hypothetical protein
MRQDFKSMQKTFLQALTYFILVFFLIMDIIIMSRIIKRNRDYLPCFTMKCLNFSIPSEVAQDIKLGWSANNSAGLAYGGVIK